VLNHLTVPTGIFVLHSSTASLGCDRVKIRKFLNSAT
jgi:hypothetical protein